LNICLFQFREIYSNSASVDLPSLRLSPGCLLPRSAPFCFSSLFDFRPAHATFRDLTVGPRRSSVFFEFIRPPSNPSLLLQGASTFLGLRRLSVTFGFAQFVSFIFLRRFSISFLDCRQPSSGFFWPFSTFCDVQWLLNSIRFDEFVPMPFLVRPSLFLLILTVFDEKVYIGNIRESMANKKSKYTFSNPCKLYEKLLRSRSSNITQFRLHLYLLLRFREMHVPYHLFPPL
jgi:hypothetical protein